MLGTIGSFVFGSETFGGPLAVVGAVVQSEVAPDLIAAWMSYFDETATLTEAFDQSLPWSAKRFRDAVDQGTELPYVVVSASEADQPTYTTGGGSVRTVAVLVKIFSDDEYEATVLGHLVREAYKPIAGRTPLRWLDGTELARFLGESGSPIQDPGGRFPGLVIWTYRLPMDFLVDQQY